MTLLDVDKIIIKRTIVGIRCSECGGNLVISKKKSITSRILKVFSFGIIQTKNYECETCKKRHLLF